MEETNNVKFDKIEESNSINKLNNNINKTEDAKEEGESISNLINKEVSNKLIEMGYSKNVSEKATFLSQNNIDKALEWIYENQNEPDFEEELRMIDKPNTSNLNPEEIKAKAKELQDYARKKYLQKEKEREEEQEKNRIRMTKELAKAKRELEDAETKRFIESQKRKKIEEEKEKRAMLEQLARDKEERFGKKFAVGGAELKKDSNPYDDAKYYIEAIPGLYPKFRNGDKAYLCLNTIKIIINNILKNPNEDKFKKIKMTNPNVQERIVSIQIALKMLKIIGFKDEGEFYVISDINTELLKNIVEVLQKEINKLN